MNNRYPFFKYIKSDSKIHLMNSKQKIIIFLLSILSCILISNYVSLVIVALFLAVMISFTKISLEAYIINLKRLWWLYLIFFILLYVVTLDINCAVIVTLKIMLIILTFLILTFTTSLSEIAWGFECVLKKLKKVHFPVSKVSLRIAMNIKFISMLFEQSYNVRKSMAYRGIPYNKRKISTFNRMVVPVVSLSYKLSRRMAKTMKLRFYGNSTKRTNYHENKVTNLSKIFITTLLIILYVVSWLRWG